MRSYDAATSAALGTREGVCARILIWVIAKNRVSGEDEAVGLWTGNHDREFTIGSETRLYAGVGSIMQVPPIRMQAGLSVRMQRLTLSQLSTEVADLILTYQSRFAPIEIHRALFSTDDGSLVAPPHRMWKGFIDEVEVNKAETGGEATCEVTAASLARLLTRILSLKRSDATQQLRSGDRFRRYVDISGKVDVWWGEARTGGGGAASPVAGVPPGFKGSTPDYSVRPASLSPQPGRIGSPRVPTR